MKKVLLVIALFLITGSALSQPIKLGVKGGITMLSTNIRGFEDAREKLKSNDIGYSLGVMARVQLPLVGLYVQPELMYNHAKYKATNSDGAVSKLSYNNLELPVLLGFKFLFFRLNAGPVFNLKTFDKGDNNYNVYRPNFGYQAGVGASLGKIDVDLRYQGYFGKKVEDINLSDLKLNDNIKVNNRIWALTVGYFF